MKQTYVRLNFDEREKLEAIKENYGCITTNEAIRIAVRETSKKIKRGGKDGVC